MNNILIFILGMIVGCFICIFTARLVLQELDKRLDGLAELRIAKQILLAPIPIKGGLNARSSRSRQNKD